MWDPTLNVQVVYSIVTSEETGSMVQEEDDRQRADENALTHKNSCLLTRQPAHQRVSHQDEANRDKNCIARHKASGKNSGK